MNNINARYKYLSNTIFKLNQIINHMNIDALTESKIKIQCVCDTVFLQTVKFRHLR